MKFSFLLLLLFISNLSFSQSFANTEYYEAANKALRKPAAGERRVVFIGNSITEEWKKKDSQFFARTDYVNRGISGQTSAQMLLRFRQDVILLQPKVVVIAAGINDIAENAGPVSVENIMNNIISMADLAFANNIRVVFTSVLPAKRFSWRKHIEPEEKIIALNKMIKAHAAKTRSAYVDYYSVMVTPDKSLNPAYTYDGVHPNQAGYKIMGAFVQSAIALTVAKR